MRNARRDIPLGSKTDIIHRDDWAALSDAFVQQLRLQHERSETVNHVAMATAEEDRDASIDAPRHQPRTYLELRDALRAM